MPTAEYLLARLTPAVMMTGRARLRKCPRFAPVTYFEYVDYAALLRRSSGKFFSKLDNLLENILSTNNPPRALETAGIVR